MGIGLLGPVRADGATALEPRDRTTLIVLAVRRGTVASPGDFAEALWGDELPRSWAKQVQICVGRMRKVLGANAIETVPGGYRLALDGDDLDLYLFEQHIQRGRSLQASGEADRATVAYARALSLWRGSPFEEIDGWVPGHSEAARLEELRRSAREEWLDARLTAGDHRAVAVDAESLVSDEPLRERGWALLATAQYRCGRQADALRSLSRARRNLREELGINPGQELVELEAAILRQDHLLAPAPQTATVSDACPYKGLAHYDVDDSESFYGRGVEVAACVARLRTSPVLVVTGPSGCGKSSLVRAGLVPALRGTGRSVVAFTPGTDPRAALLDAAPPTHAPAVLVIDQFEELFTLGAAPDVVSDFCRSIAEYACGRAPVVIAVRSDQLGGLNVEPTLSRLAEQGLHLLNSLAGDALRQAIEQPAKDAGLRLDPGLVDVLVRDCEGEPGALPLLSHSLVETWQRRDGNVLTVEGYRASGGIRVAVARSADRLYESLTAEQRQTLRAVLLRLVAPSLDGDPVRCRVPSRSLLGDPGREQVVALLVRSRLVTSEEDAFELAHEALARAWPRLRSWLDDDAAGQRVLRHLTAAADGWESLGRAESELYRGARLEAALEWREATSPDLNAVEREFVDASAQTRDLEQRSAAEQIRRQARVNRRLRVLLVVAALALVVALVGSLIALDQRRDANRQRRVATARELAAASAASLDDDPERSILLALAAIDATRSSDGPVIPEAEEALHEAVTSSRVLLNVPGAGGRLDWSPTGDVFVTEGQEESGLVDIRDAETGEPVLSFRGDAVDLNEVAFSPDGKLLATVGDDGSLKAWNPTTGEQLWTVQGAGPVWTPVFSGDGSHLLAVWFEEGLIRVIDRTGAVVSEVDNPNVSNGVALSPDASRIVRGREDPWFGHVIDAGSGKELFALEGDDTWSWEYEWSPDGRWIAGTIGNTAQVWDATTGAARLTIAGHLGEVTELDWSSDSGLLATSSDDGTARVWELGEASAIEMFRFAADDFRNGAYGLAFSPDGTRLMVGDRSITSVKVFDLTPRGGAEWATVQARPHSPRPAALTLDGRRLLTSMEDGEVAAWDVTSGKHLAGFAGKDSARLVISPDGALVAGTTGYDLPVTVWDVATGDEVAAFSPDTSTPRVPDMAWSPDGQHLAVVHGLDGENRVAIVDRAGVEVAQLDAREPDANFSSVSFSPDGRLLATTQLGRSRSDPAIENITLWAWETGEVARTLTTQSSKVAFAPAGELLVSNRVQEGTLDVWDVGTGEQVATLTGHTALVSDIAFSGDGAMVATAGADGTARIWDPRSGAQLHVLRGHDIGLASVELSPDGTRLLSAGDDGMVRVWALVLDDLIGIANDRLTRTLTDDECRQYLHVERCPDG